MFCTYGTPDYENAMRRIQDEISSVFPKTMAFRPGDLDADFVENTSPFLQRVRGAGYWLWKPWVVSKALECVEDHEYVLYADAGCRVSRDSETYQQWFDNISKTSGKSVLVFEMPGNLEYQWTTKHCADVLGATQEAMESPQRAATFMLLRKCEDSCRFIDAWLSFAKKRPDIFSDDFNQDVLPGFKDHRHDQSVLSLLSKDPRFANSICVREFCYFPIRHACQK